MVLHGPADKLQGLGRPVAGRVGALLLVGAVEDGPGEGGRVHPHVVGGYHGLEPLAADIHLDLVILQGVAVHDGKADGPLGGLLQDDGLQSLALVAVVGHHGAAGDEADLLTALVHRHPRPHDALVQQGDGQDAPGQVRRVGEIPVLDALERLVLLRQGLAADEVPLLRRKADGEFRQGHGEDGDLLPLRVVAHVVAVEGQAGLQAEGVPGPQARGLGPQLDEPVPEPFRSGALDVDLVAQRLAGVAGLGHPDGVPLELKGIQGVLHRLGDGLAAGEGL